MSAFTAASPRLTDESRLALGLRVREPGALGEAYQTYGERLFDYAMGMLGNREAAEDAVHDALLVAAHRIATLQRHEELPLWLYALTRNECLRQARRGRQVTAAPDHTVHVGPDVAVDHARAWVRDAAAQLPSMQREALDLASRHGLTASELAAVLGVPAKQAAVLLAAAGSALEQALDALSAVRAGPSCAHLGEALTGWDGRFSERIVKHVASCRACAPATWDGVGAVELFCDLPPELPPRLLERRLLATAAVPSRVASRADIAEPFERTGYPVPLDRTARWRPLLAGAGIAASVLLVAAWAWASQPERSGLIVAVDRPSVDLPRGAEQASGEPSPTAPASPDGVQGGAPPDATPVPSSATQPAPSAAQPPPVAAPSSAPSPIAAQPDPEPAGPAQVNATMADVTTGCSGTWWTGTATVYVQGAIAQSATLRWGASTAMPNSVPMRLVRTGMYQASRADLPANVTVFWQVVVVTTDGRTISTSMATIKHERQC